MKIIKEHVHHTPSIIISLAVCHPKKELYFLILGNDFSLFFIFLSHRRIFPVLLFSKNTYFFTENPLTFPAHTCVHERICYVKADKHLEIPILFILLFLHLFFLRQLHPEFIPSFLFDFHICSPDSQEKEELCEKKILIILFSFQWMTTGVGKKTFNFLPLFATILLLARIQYIRRKISSQFLPKVSKYSVGAHMRSKGQEGYERGSYGFEC